MFILIMKSFTIYIIISRVLRSFRIYFQLVFNVCLYYGPCLGFAVCGWVHILEHGQHRTIIFLRLTVEKIRTVAVSTENVYGHAALVALILRLRLTVNI